LVNNYDGVSQGVDYLINKGYSRIGFVCNDLNLIQMQERKQAYFDTLKRNHIRANKQLMLTTSFNDTKDELVGKITGFLKNVKPEAVMFAANYLGVYGLESIKTAGVKIPDDMAVVCFDDHELFSLYSPEITVIRQPIEEIAKKAVAILIDQMSNNKKIKERQVQLKGKMIERMSA